MFKLVLNVSETVGIDAKQMSTATKFLFWRVYAWMLFYLFFDS